MRVVNTVRLIYAQLSIPNEAFHWVVSGLLVECSCIGDVVSTQDSHVHFNIPTVSDSKLVAHQIIEVM